LNFLCCFFRFFNTDFSLSLISTASSSLLMMLP
jgi:hypothetical protein